MDQLLRSALAQRLGEHLRSQVEPLGGLLHGQDQSALERAGTGLRLGTALPKALLDALGLAREAVDYGSKVGTGLLAVPAAYGVQRQEEGPSNDPLTAFLQGAGANTPNPLMVAMLAGKLGLPSPYGSSDAANTRAAFEASDGNPIGKLRAANEGLAKDSPLATGVVNQLTNPLSYVSGGGSPEALAAARAGRVASGLNLDLNLVNQILYPEGQALGAAASKAISKVGAPLTQKALTAILRGRYGPPLETGPREFADYATHMGLPTPEKIAQESSDLAPEGLVSIRKLLREAVANNPRTKAIAARIGSGLPAEALPPLDRNATLAGFMRDIPPTPDAPTLDIGRDYPAALAREIVGGPSEPLASKIPGVQLVSDLVRAGERSAQPNALEGLLGAARGTAARDVPLPTPPTSAQLPLVNAPVREPLDVMRELLQTGDGGRGMVYPPSDPTFWARRTGVDPALVPDFLRQLETEGALASDPRSGLINRLLAGGPREPLPPVDNSLELPDMSRLGANEDEALNQLTSDEIATLVAVAYPTETAQGNAIAKYQNPLDLVRRAVERIQTSRPLAEYLAGEHPELAGRIADIPGPLDATLDELPPEGWTGKLGITPGAAVQQAGRWLTRDQITGLPGINRLGIAGSGALTGTALGGLAPADTPEDRRRNMVTGGVAGAGAGLGLSSATARPVLERVTNTAGQILKEANIAQLASMKRESKGIKALADLPTYWGPQTTENLKNLLQSPLTAMAWMKNAGVRVGEFAKNYASLADLFTLGQRNPYDVQPAMTTAILDALGMTGHIMEGGTSFHKSNGDLIEQLSAKDMALLNGVLATLNPAYGGIPGAGLALGLGIGYGRAWLHTIYKILDNFAEQAARHAVFQDEVAPLLKVAGTDFLDRNGLTGALSPDGLFSGDDVAQLAGQAAGDEWAATAKKVVALSEGRARDILGDFSKRGSAEKIAGSAIPFIGWAVRAYPRTAKMMLDHPGVSLALTMLMFNAAEGDRKEGVPGYQVGNVAIGQDAPVLGGIAKALTGGQPGEMRVNLLSGLSPVGGSVLAEDDLPEDANLYQQAKGALSRVGFAPSPVIQALAYGLNKDYQKPGALSRTAGIETVLGGPEVPSLAAGPLNKLREAAGGSAQTSTPHDRKLAEVYYRLTGHVISDPSNMQDPERRALLLDTLNPDSEIRQQADREMAIQGVTKSALSLGSPVTATPRTDIQVQQQQTRQDRQALPPARYTPQQIAAMEKTRGMNAQIEAYLMQRANKGTQGEVPPILQLTRGASGGERGQDILSGLTEGSLFGGGNYYQTYLLQSLLGIQPTR